jgi:hypothetical protein
MGRVRSDWTSNWVSGSTAADDMKAWSTAGQPGSTTVCSLIPASDEAVDASGSAVLADMLYTATFNSNSAAHAVAEDAAQACLEIPGDRWAPGAKASGGVGFDKDKNGRRDPKFRPKYCAIQKGTSYGPGSPALYIDGMYVGK